MLRLDVMVGKDEDKTLVIESATLQVGKILRNLTVGIMTGIQVTLELGKQADQPRRVDVQFRA